MREHSIPALEDVPTIARLTDVVHERAGREPGTVVARRKADQGWRLGAQSSGGPPGTWQDVTARQFRDEVAALAKGLAAAGIGAGDRVALMSRTRYEWTLLDYAIWTAGAVTVPVYETSSPEQVEWILSDSGARAFIMETPAHEQTNGEVLRRLPSLERTWLIEGGTAAGGSAAHPGAAGSLASLATGGTGVSDGQLEERRTAVTAGDLATIIYTSGTTGRPKGCELTHANLLADVRNALAGPLAQIFAMPECTTLLFLPLAHVFARVIQIGCFEGGCVLGHAPDVSALLPDLASLRPTFILAVPRVFEKVYNGAEQQALASSLKGPIFRSAAATAIAWSRAQGEPGGPGPGLRLAHGLFDHLVYSKLRTAIGGKVRFAVSGGAPLGERLGHFFRGAGITIIEGYGLTETTAAATVNPPGNNKIGTVGLPLPGVSVRTDEDGEILIKGPNVFAGYWQNPAATAEILDAGGWLRTGDIGELDHEGFLRVTGRKKDLIITAGGKNVAPAVLEDRIRAHPLVSQCVVVGDARPYVACLITLDAEALEPWTSRRGKPEGAGAGELAADADLLAELQAAVDDANKAVSRAEAIKRFRVLTIDFTEQDGYLTPSLKVRRAMVVKDFASEIEALYA